ncbi:trypsin-1 [Drosophila grimshawi]|uniref:trypsin n=1 Tax=Drosophila grimshawi TaxID=7222 RepID=B4IX48_DROGR|nr:trypsin-1 [Drosophila grimshawi]EDV96354.1 GH15251 [Drosophila grimshawi]
MIWLWLCYALLCVLDAAGGQRIVGGQETSIRQVPYLVYLRQGGKFICGGSLLSPSCVLSAAHCVYGAEAKDYTVHAGASRLEAAAPVVRNVAQFHIAPSYDPGNFDMDVAILQLSSRIHLSAGQVTTIAPCRTAPGSNAYVRISGWGVRNEESREPAAQVRTTLVRVVPQRECQQAYAGQAQISDSMLCAAVRGIRDSCSGDSGGPLVYRGEVCGIVSWGFGCARAAYPGVYTNVASNRVRNFVDQTLRKLRS